ncbi:hypothetical protein BKA64DRAFT_120791 [Cadophora sp. MPI-SDFR-AT-0126]|nr:hypothetical protein BKA64DRAFT_120791 [Leotiomycetes sp. MPI-SDFR-AT-0126]
MSSDSLTLSILLSLNTTTTGTPLNNAETRLSHKFVESVLPMHTFDDVPKLVVLIVPGGLETRVPTTLPEPIKSRYQSLQYLTTTSTGSWPTARSRSRTGEVQLLTKWIGHARQWETKPKVKWVTKTRWIVDGNIWTSTGVAASIHVTIV